MYLPSLTAHLRRPLRRGLRGVLAAGFIGMTAAGCTLHRADVTEATPVDYRQRHPISIREGERTTQVFVGVYRAGLTPAQRADVAIAAREWKREATGGILIEVPTDTPNAGAAQGAVRDIIATLRAAGVPGQFIATRPYTPATETRLATIRIHYPRMVAEAGPCGLWPEDLGPAPEAQHNENRPYYNLGCASQRNMAAMVENPADLVQPRGETAIYAARRSVVIDKFRKGENPATVYTTGDKGTISNVGK